MVHNVSMQMDLEMILSLLMDVAVAMAYFYRLELPVAHQQLSSTEVGATMEETHRMMPLKHNPAVVASVRPHHKCLSIVMLHDLCAHLVIY